MDSIARALRIETRRAVLALAPAARIALAFALGEDDLATFMRSSGLPRPQAIARLRAARHVGRRPSACLAPGEP